MTLHTVNLVEESPNCQTLFEQLIPGDEVIFLEKGLGVLTKNSKYSQAIANLCQNNKVNFYFLEHTKLENTTIPAKELLEFGERISFSDFVELTVKHEKTISWF